MNSRSNLYQILPSVLLIWLLSSSLGFTQEALSESPREDYAQIQNKGYDWSIKVLWLDKSGVKQRTKGRVLMAHSSGIIVRQSTGAGQFRQLSIPVRSIVKMKYRPGDDPLPDILIGAFDGALGGGPFQIRSGNLGIDLLAGALSGALTGLISNPREPARVVWVNGNSAIYKDRVLRDLGFVSNGERRVDE